MRIFCDIYIKDLIQEIFNRNLLYYSILLERYLIKYNVENFDVGGNISIRKFANESLE